jgi:Ras-related protein Rab-8A
MQRRPSEDRIKIVLIGDSGVGKTAIFSRLQTRGFTPNTKTTIGAACANVDITGPGGDSVLLILWDTAGQDSFRSIIPMYFSHCAFILIVYDVTDVVSFHDVKKWQSLSQEKAPKAARIIVVGNKCDLEDARAITPGQGAQQAEEIGATGFFGTSAATGSGIEEITAFIARTVASDFDAITNIRPPPGLLIVKAGGDAEKKKCC